MGPDFKPVERSNLADDLAESIAQMIQTGTYQAGDRLPAITEMARKFGVGHPTVREALKQLETVGVVEIKHGSGVYVKKGQDVLLVSNRVFGGVVSKKLMLDLIQARTAIETLSVQLAAANATEEQFCRMAELLDEAGANLTNDSVLNMANMAFHRTIAESSGNLVLAQLQDVLSDLFQREQRLILDIYGSRDKDHDEHVEILEALRSRDSDRSVALMRKHLDGVRDALLRWDPESNPIP